MNHQFISSIIEKMRSLDADFRYMALNDLTTELQSGKFSLDENSERTLVPAILKMLEDNNGEVKTMAVKTIGYVVTKVSLINFNYIIKHLIALLSSKKDDQIDMGIVGFKAIIASATRYQLEKASVTDQILPIFLQNAKEDNTSPDLLDLLADILSRAHANASVLKTEQDQKNLVASLLTLTGHKRLTIRKRVVNTFSALIPLLKTSVVQEFIQNLLNELIQAAASGSHDEQYVIAILSLVSTSARLKSDVVSNHISEFVQLLSRLVDREDEELKEACLQTLEGFSVSCQVSMVPYIAEFLKIAAKYVKYDPNYVNHDDESMEDDLEGGEEKEEEDEDKEEEEDDYDDYGDDEDISWKVRKASIKLISSIIEANTFTTVVEIFDNISSIILPRFKEREELVRVDVIQAMVSLVRVFGKIKADRHHRDNHFMEVNADEKSTNVHQRLSKILPSQMNVKSTATCSAALNLLKEVCLASNNALASSLTMYLRKIDLFMEGSSNQISIGSQTVSLKSQTLSLLKTIFATHQPALISKEIPCCASMVIKGVQDKFYKTAVDGLDTLIALVAMFSNSQANEKQILFTFVPKITQLLIELTQSKETDIEVKNKAHIALAHLVVVFGGLKESAKIFQEVVPIFIEHLSNEVTLMNGLTTLEILFANHEQVPHSETFDDALPQMSSILVSQLKKSSRSLRSASLSLLLKMLRSGFQMTIENCQQVAQASKFLLSDQDTTMIQHTLSLLTFILCQGSAVTGLEDIVQQELIPQLLKLMVDSSHIFTSDSAKKDLKGFWSAVASSAKPQSTTSKTLYQLLIDTISKHSNRSNENGNFTSLKSSFILLATSASVVILASGSQKTWQLDTIAQLMQEIQNPKSSVTTKFVNLYIMGEIGAVAGQLEAELSKTFKESVLQQLDSVSLEVQYASAYALGNIAASDLNTHLNEILSLMQQSGPKQHLMLFVLREIIKQGGNDHSSLVLKSNPKVWDILFSIADSISTGKENETIRTAIAECVAILMMSNLETLFDDSMKRIAQGTVHARVSILYAIRHVVSRLHLRLSSSSEDLATAKFLNLLKQNFISLVAILKEEDLLVKRAILSMVNSCIHHQPDVLRISIDTMLPSLLEELNVKEELISIVEMGPFKHKVDEGVDIRKNAYECVRSIVNISSGQERYLQDTMVPLVNGLRDPSSEIRMLVHLTLQKLSFVAPHLVASHLDSFVPAIIQEINEKAKPNAVKQEIERLQEIQRSVIRLCLVLANLFYDSQKVTSHNSPKFEEELLPILKASNVAHPLYDLIASLEPEVQNMIQQQKV